MKPSMRPVVELGQAELIALLLEINVALGYRDEVDVIERIRRAASASLGTNKVREAQKP